ncbi:MAG: hypothetical protein K8F91_22360 [Candidatus Obscuribacterales bacterium]|nr:hypothetical protein [Candidatus Obscuribacterales bacterium]
MGYTLDPKGIGLAIIMLVVVCFLRHRIVESTVPSFFSFLRPYKRDFHFAVFVLSVLFSVAWIVFNEATVDSMMMNWYLTYFGGLMFLGSEVWGEWWLF